MKILCVDVEAFEHCRSFILEVGVTRFSIGKPGLITNHFIVEQNLKKRNGKWVPDNRDGFVHGESQVLRHNNIVWKLRNMLKEADGLLGHSLRDDVHYLRRMGVEVGNIRRFDTQTFAKKDMGKQQRSLQTLFDFYVGGEFIAHNAGNDSHATSQVFVEQVKRGLVFKE